MCVRVCVCLLETAGVAPLKEMESRIFCFLTPPVRKLFFLFHPCCSRCSAGTEFLWQGVILKLLSETSRVKFGDKFLSHSNVLDERNSDFSDFFFISLTLKANDRVPISPFLYDICIVVYFAEMANNWIIKCLDKTSRMAFIDYIHPDRQKVLVSGLIITAIFPGF